MDPRIWAIRSWLNEYRWSGRYNRLTSLSNYFPQSIIFILKVSQFPHLFVMNVMRKAIDNLSSQINKVSIAQNVRRKRTPPGKEETGGTSERRLWRMTGGECSAHVCDPPESEAFGATTVKTEILS